MESIWALLDDDDYGLGGVHDTAVNDALRHIALRAELVEEIECGKRKRAPNKHRDRLGPLQQIATWSDRMFERQFRVSRAEFVEIRDSAQVHFRQRNVKKAVASSGSPIPFETRLLCTFRLLAGASYLDMIWYGVDVDKIWEVAIEVLGAMNKCEYLDNIKVPETAEEVADCLKEWRGIQQRKHGVDLLPGTLLAGDGLAIKILQISEMDAQRVGVNVRDFFNRKGFHALIVQAFCDAFGRIRSWQMKWPGSTNDIIAYKQSDIYTNVFSNLPADSPLRHCHLVLDEAYCSIGGDLHLCPYTKHQLLKAKRDAGTAWNNPDSLYNKMLAFNNRLSSQRITIERVFGMYMRRWGVMWQPLEHDVETCILIATVCAKLHNVCVERWVKRGQHRPPANFDGVGAQRKDDNLRGDDNDAQDAHVPTDAEVMAARENDAIADLERLGSTMREIGRAAHSTKRENITDYIYNSGFVYNRK